MTAITTTTAINNNSNNDRIDHKSEKKHEINKENNENKNENENENDNNNVLLVSTVVRIIMMESTGSNDKNKNKTTIIAMITKIRNRIE